MAFQKMGEVEGLRLGPAKKDDKSRFRWRLQFAESGREGRIEFDMTAELLMRLLLGLKELQALYKLPIPPTPRPPGGKPKLYVVEIEN